MKKLMILGAIAATAVGYGADAGYLAQVYDAKLTLKTGVCKAGKATAATVKYYEAYLGKDNAPFAKGAEMGFRKQATRKINGVFWGCECETIALPLWRTYRSTSGWNLGGYAFWDETANAYFVLPNTRFAWDCLNRINNDFKTVEGAWRLANNTRRQLMRLNGAGFGKATVASLPCRSIVSSISGSFAGSRLPGLDDLVSDCPYCGVGACNIRPFCEGCRFWTASTVLTAAYGSWSIKFNKSAANKLKNTMRITQSYKFGKKDGGLANVLARMEQFVSAVGRVAFFNDVDPWASTLTGGSAALSRRVVGLAYLYALKPSAVTLNADATVSVDLTALLLADLGLDAEDAEDFDLESEDLPLEIEKAYLNATGDALITAEDLEEESDENYIDYEDCKSCMAGDSVVKSTVEDFVSELNSFVGTEEEEEEEDQS